MLDADVKQAQAIRSCDKNHTTLAKSDVDQFKNYHNNLARNGEDKKFQQPAWHSVLFLSIVDVAAASTTYIPGQAYNKNAEQDAGNCEVSAETGQVLRRFSNPF